MVEADRESTEALAREEAMTPEEKEKFEAEVVAALGRATDEQIEEVYELLREQAGTVRAMKGCTPAERMALAERYTNLKMRVEMLFATMLGLGIRMVVAPDGSAKGFGYVLTTGEPVIGSMEMTPFKKGGDDVANGGAQGKTTGSAT